jgi:hypothetical protein
VVVFLAQLILPAVSVTVSVDTHGEDLGGSQKATTLHHAATAYICGLQYLHIAPSIFLLSVAFSDASRSIYSTDSCPL